MKIIDACWHTNGIGSAPLGGVYVKVAPEDDRDREIIAACGGDRIYQKLYYHSPHGPVTVGTNPHWITILQRMAESHQPDEIDYDNAVRPRGSRTDKEVRAWKAALALSDPGWVTKYPQHKEYVVTPGHVWVMRYGVMLLEIRIRNLPSDTGED